MNISSKCESSLKYMFIYFSCYYGKVVDLHILNLLIAGVVRKFLGYVGICDLKNFIYSKYLFCLYHNWNYQLDLIKNGFLSAPTDSDAQLPGLQMWGIYSALMANSSHSLLTVKRKLSSKFIVHFKNVFHYSSVFIYCKNIILQIFL